MTGFILYDRAGFERNRWFASKMAEYAEHRGVTLSVIIREELDISLNNSAICLLQNGIPIDPPDFVINRCIDPFAARCLELGGIRVFNSAEACSICNDKRLTHAFFAGKGIKMADTLFCSKEYPVNQSISFPSVVKSAVGHGGSEVFMVNNQSELDSCLDAIKSNKYLIQQPISPFGRDLRVYVLGGKILCSVLRSCDRDFRSNFSLGGNASLYQMSDRQKELVYYILSLLPLTFAGIDFIFNGEEMLLNEIEDIVGSRMIYSLTDMPVHSLFIDTVLKELE